MDTRQKLNKEFFSQEFDGNHPYAEMLNRYKVMASNYARMENVVAVLSDMRTDRSYIYYGRFAHELGLKGCDGNESSSIWEDDIFRLIHPDDLADKHLQELCFSHFVRHEPANRRADYFLMSKLRMRNAVGNYIQVMHRMFYVFLPEKDTLWLALCLYGPLIHDIPKCMFVNSANGQVFMPDRQSRNHILSDREKQVLRLIDKGQTSKDIAETLCISIHTVNRHRQDILRNLQAKNAIEACRVAKEMRLI